MIFDPDFIVTDVNGWKVISPPPGLVELDLNQGSDALWRAAVDIIFRDVGVVINLTQVVFIDGIVLQSIYKIGRQAEECGAHVRLVLAERCVRRIFEITGAEDFFDIRDTLESTIADRPGI